MANVAAHGNGFNFLQVSHADNSIEPSQLCQIEFQFPSSPSPLTPGRYVIESPRWLISKRRFGDAIVQFKKIAKINGRDFDVTEKELAEIYREDKHEVTYGIASLFAGWRLARNTIIMGFSWCDIDRRKKSNLHL